MERLIAQHLLKNKYLPTDRPGQLCYHNRMGWNDYRIGPHLLYSHRVTDYTRERFDEAYHAHDHYELLVYVSGEVDYICENEKLAPPPMSAVWFSPGDFHNARLLRDSRYERYVFRCHPDVFRLLGGYFPMLSFVTDHPDQGFFPLHEEVRKEISSLLESLDKELDQEHPNLLLCFSFFLQILTCLNEGFAKPPVHAEQLPEAVLELKQYLHDHYTTLQSVSELSEHFFYSREHVSRIFKKYFNTTVADYLCRYRIAQSIPLLESGKSVTEVCFFVGFQSVSAFSSSFKRTVGCLPSEYIKRRKNPTT